MAKMKQQGKGRAPIIIPKPELVSPPGTIAPPPGSAPPRLSVIAYQGDRLDEEEVEGIAALQELRRQTPDGVIWVNIEGVGDAAIFKELGEFFGLHSLALEDAVHLHQRPKVEDYSDHTYVVLQMPVHDDAESFEQVSIFFGSDYVITIQEGVPGDCFGPLRQRIRSARARVRLRGADYLAYAVMDAIIDSFFPMVERLNHRLEQFEDRVINLEGDEIVTDLHGVRHELHTLRRVLALTQEAIGLLVRGEAGPMVESTLPFLRDCQDHTAQLLDAVEALRELVAGLMELHLAGSNNRMNEVMKVLTIIATIFMPLSFIAGLYGMNFDRTASPWNMPELGWRLGYPFVLLLMVGTTVSFLYYFRRRRWLGTGPRRAREHTRTP